MKMKVKSTTETPQIALILENKHLVMYPFIIYVSSRHQFTSQLYLIQKVELKK